MARCLGVLALGGGAGTTITWIASAGLFLLSVACVLAVAAVIFVSCAIHLHFHSKDDKTRGAAITHSASDEDSPAHGFHGFKCLPSYPGRAVISGSKKLLISKKWGQSEVEDELKAYDRAAMEEEDGAGVSVWQRTILMGERCQPPDFSGAIIYDDKGNQLPAFPPRSPKLNIFHLSLEQPDAVQQR